VPLSRRTLIHGAPFAIGLLVLPAQAYAQGWPSRPIKLVVPTGPGAATDVMARLLSDGISRALGQTVVVENQPGASGILAHQTVARAAPDGYTFLFTNTSGMIFNKISFKQLPYDPLRDFTPVASVCSQGSQMVSVNASVPAQSVPELIAYAKANRGKLSIAFDVTAGAAGVATRQRRQSGADELDRGRQRGGAGRQGAAARGHLGDALPGPARSPGAQRNASRSGG